MDKQILEKIKADLRETSPKTPSNMTGRIMDRIGTQSRRTTVKDIYSLIIRPAVAVPVFAALFLGLAVFTFSTRHKTTQVVFRMENPSASSIHVAGDFNDWNPAGYRMDRVNGHWQLVLNLEPGKYEYAFVINGEKWILDPENKTCARSESGQENSVISVGNTIL